MGRGHFTKWLQVGHRHSLHLNDCLYSLPCEMFSRRFQVPTAWRTSCSPQVRSLRGGCGPWSTVWLRIRLQARIIVWIAHVAPQTLTSTRKAWMQPTWRTPYLGVVHMYSYAIRTTEPLSDGGLRLVTVISWQDHKHVAYGEQSMAWHLPWKKCHVPTKACCKTPRGRPGNHCCTIRN